MDCYSSAHGNNGNVKNFGFTVNIGMGMLRFYYFFKILILIPNIPAVEQNIKLGFLFNQLENNKSFIDDSRPIELLHIASEVNVFLLFVHLKNI